VTKIGFGLGAADLCARNKFPGRCTARRCHSASPRCRRRKSDACRAAERRHRLIRSVAVDIRQLVPSSSCLMSHPHACNGQSNRENSSNTCQTTLGSWETCTQAHERSKMTEEALKKSMDGRKGILVVICDLWTGVCF